VDVWYYAVYLVVLGVSFVVVVWVLYIGILFVLCEARLFWCCFVFGLVASCDLLFSAVFVFYLCFGCFVIWCLCGFECLAF